MQHLLFPLVSGLVVIVLTASTFGLHGRVRDADHLNNSYGSNPEAAVTERSSHYAPDRAKELIIAALFPLSHTPDSDVSGRLGRGVLPAAILARDHINRHHNFLRGYQFKLDINDTACDAALGVTALMHMLGKPGKRLMVLGSGCINTTGPIAQASQFHGLVQLSYADTHPVYDHIKFPNLYRIAPSENQYNFARLALLREFNWTEVAILYQNESRYSLAYNHLMSRISDPPYQVVAQSSFNDIGEIRTALDTFKNKSARIIIGNFDETWARIIFCEAYAKCMYGRPYQWIIWGGYSQQWWERPDALEALNCTAEQLMTAVHGSISTDILPLSIDGKRMTIGGLDTDMYEQSYNIIRRKDYSEFHGYAYDAVWAMAKAISIVMDRLPSGESIDDFEYKSEKWSKRFLDGLNKTEFIGVTGHVKFFENEREGTIRIKQLQVRCGSEGMSGKEDLIALFHNGSDALNFSFGKPIFLHDSTEGGPTP